MFKKNDVQHFMTYIFPRDNRGYVCVKGFFSGMCKMVFSSYHIVSISSVN